MTDDTPDLTPVVTPDVTAADLPPLVLLGDAQLAQPSAPVQPGDISTPEFRRKLALLRLGLDVHGANGIAAPQLGWFERFLFMRDPSGGDEVVCWINPEIVHSADEQVGYWEGCLSVPGYKAFVMRSAAVAVRGLDAQGQPLNREFTGWEAHLFQHEFDHLDGILFPYRVADPRHMVTTEALEQRDQWPPDWPAPGAHNAPVRVIRD